MNTSEQKVSSVEINCKCEAQAKTAILNFLDKLGIKKIVYVDDRCSINGKPPIKYPLSLYL